MGDPSDEDTVTETVSSLRADGYVGDAYAVVGGVRCATCRTLHDVDSLVVERSLRVEGPTDPADAAIVLGLRCVSCGSKLLLVAGYGAEASAEDQDLVAALGRLG